MKKKKSVFEICLLDQIYLIQQIKEKLRFTKFYTLQEVLRQFYILRDVATKF